MSTTTRTYGPCRLSKLELMGIRFMVPNVDEGAGTATATAADAEATTDKGAAASTASQDTADGSSAAAEKVEDLPVWAQKIITDTRKEAGDHRAAAKTAADNATKALTDKFAVALGLKPDAATDPTALNAALATAEQARAQSARELAVYKGAAAAGADPAKLLDRASFLTSIASVDPTDGAALAAAIKTAVDADNTLKAARAAGASTVDTPGGTGETGQITEAQLAQMTPEQISDAFDKGLLKHLL